MALPANLSAYRSHINAMNTAVTHDGAVMTMGTPGQALRFRQMCYNIRKIYRDKGMEHPWDDLVIRADGEKVVIKVEPTSVLAMTTLDGKPIDLHKPMTAADLLKEMNMEMTKGDIEYLEREALKKGELFIVPAGVRVIEDAPSGDDIVNSLE